MIIPCQHLTWYSTVLLPCFFLPGSRVLAAADESHLPFPVHGAVLEGAFLCFGCLSHMAPHVLHGLALAFEVSCSGTAEIQEGLFKIINPVFYRVSNSNSAMKLRENGLQELLLSLCEGITSRTDLFLLTCAKANAASLGFVSFRLWRSWCREQRVAATRRRKDKLS